MTYRLLYNVTTRKVGCVILQAFGGTLPSGLFHKFFGDSNCWTLNPEGLAVYSITEEQLPALAAKTDFSRNEQ